MIRGQLPLETERLIAHTAVWTGSEMIVWGKGFDGSSALSDGDLYNPTTDSWTASSNDQRA